MNFYGDYQMFNTTVLLINLLILGSGFVIWLAEYILQGMGLYKIAQAQGEDSPWMAYVPWLRTYLHGKVAGEVPFGKKSIKNAGLWMVLTPIIFSGVMVVVFLGTMLVSMFSMNFISGGAVMMTLFLWIFMLGMCCAGIYTVFIKILRGMVNYQIYKRFNTESKAVLHMLLSLFVPLYQAIYFFLLRKRVHVEPKQQPLHEEQPMQYAQPQYSEPQMPEVEPEISQEEIQVPEQQPEIQEESQVQDQEEQKSE